MRDRYKGTSSFTLKSPHRIFQLISDTNFAYLLHYRLKDVVGANKPVLSNVPALFTLSAATRTSSFEPKTMVTLNYGLV